MAFYTLAKLSKHLDIFVLALPNQLEMKKSFSSIYDFEVLSNSFIWSFSLKIYYESSLEIIGFPEMLLNSMNLILS